MGEVVGYKCEKCGYRFDAYLGMCFGFLRIYNETVAKMKNGELGEEAKRFFDAQNSSKSSKLVEWIFYIPNIDRQHCFE
ncbi:MAG: hypothetical protein IJG51_01995 [Synergistaceae bacterium]|nr:hypothetical protein [Synergistaceae bacterium]